MVCVCLMVLSANTAYLQFFLFCTRLSVKLALLVNFIGEKQINNQDVCSSWDLGKLALDLQIPSSVLFAFTQEDFSNNKNIKDNKHLSVSLSFFLHKRTSAVIKLLLRITGRVFVFWGLFFKKFLQNFLRKTLSF